MKFCATILILIIFSSCSIQKEQRKCNRSARKIEKAIKLCPQIARTDTIRDTVMVYIPKVKIDTVLAKADTIELIKDRWRVRIINSRDSVYITGGCDSIFVEVPVEIPCDTIQPIKYVPMALKWWQVFLIVSGCILWGFIIWMVLRVVL